MQRKYMICASVATLALLPFGALLQPASAQGEQTPDQLYKGGLSNLTSISRYFTPEQKRRIPTLQAILHRVIFETDTATDDELAIGTTLITGQPLSMAGGRGATNQAILALHFKPLVASGAPTTQVVAVVKPVTKTINTKYVKIANASKSVTYTSGVVNKPGGTTSGYVDMNKGAHKTRIVEIPTGTGDLGVSGRAKIIARRLTGVQKSDPAWWSRITPGTAPDGQVVVSLPHGPVPYVLTADASFAKEWGMSPTELAQSLVTKIRTSIESSGSRGVLTTPAQEAATEKEAGDNAYAKGDLAGAEKHYKKAISDSPSYVAAYKLLINLYKEQKQTDKANGIVVEAQGEPSLTSEQLEEISNAAK